MKRLGVLLSGGLLFGCLLCACGDEELLKFDKIDGVENWTPEFSLQVAHAEYSVWGLIDQEDAEADIVLQDGRIVIRHEENDIYALNVMDELELPDVLADVDFAFNLPGAIVGTTLPVDFSEEQSGQKTVTFSEGELRELIASLTVDYTVPAVGFVYTATLILDNVYEDETRTTPVVVTLNDGGSAVLTDVVFDFSTGDPNTLYYTLKLDVPAGATVSTGTVDFSFSLGDIGFTKIVGKIDEQTIAIAEDSFNMDVDFWNDFEGSFAFTAPRLGLTVEKQQLEFPFEVKMDFTAYGDGKSEVFTGPALDFTGTDPEITRWYDNGNSNIADLLSLPPKDRIDYSGMVTLNPGGTQEITVWNDGSASVSALVEIPLELQVSDLTFNDTIDVDKVDQDIIDKILEARLVITSENHIPLELGNGHLVILDETNNQIDEIAVESFIASPTVNDEGKVTAPGINTCRIELSAKNIANLVRMHSLLLTVTAKTSNEGTVPVVILPDAKLKLAVGVEAKLNVSDL